MGRRWFQKSYGNTYHSVTIFIDGTIVHSSPIHSGYGDHYTQTAQNWLMDNKFLDIKRNANGSCTPLWSWARDNGIEYTAQYTDVARERDL